MRIRDPKTTALIFASGKMVVTGAKSEDDSKLASRKYARIIQKLGFNAKFTDFKIQNIVGSCDIKFPIRLEGLASRHHHFSSYEPELFPGLIYRMIKPKIVLLIFVSGKIVLTGAKVREEIYEAFEMIYPVLQGWHPPLTPSDAASNCVKTSARAKACMSGRLLRSARLGYNIKSPRLHSSVSLHKTLPSWRYDFLHISAAACPSQSLGSRRRRGLLVPYVFEYPVVLHFHGASGSYLHWHVTGDHRG